MDTGSRKMRTRSKVSTMSSRIPSGHTVIKKRPGSPIDEKEPSEEEREKENPKEKGEKANLPIAANSFQAAERAKEKENLMKQNGSRIQLPMGSRVVNQKEKVKAKVNPRQNQRTKASIQQRKVAKVRPTLPMKPHLRTRPITLPQKKLLGILRHGTNNGTTMCGMEKETHIHGSQINGTTKHGIAAIIRRNRILIHWKGLSSQR